MAYACKLCGKGSLFGIDKSHRHGGMWARRGTATPKKWKPNLRSVKVEIAGKMKKIRVCTSCLKKKIKQTVESK